MARKLSKLLSCRLTDDQVKAKHSELLIKMDERDNMQEEEKKRRKEYKEELDTVTDEIYELRKSISARVETREVQVEERRNDAAKTMDTIRLDAQEYWPEGEQLVNSRPLNASELQIELLADHRRDRDVEIPADKSTEEVASVTDENDPFAGIEGSEDPAEEAGFEKKKNKRSSPKTAGKSA